MEESLNPFDNNKKNISESSTIADKILSYLKKIFRLEKLKTFAYVITFIATVIGAYYTYKQYSLAKSQQKEKLINQRSENELLKDSILLKIDKIENSIKYDEIMSLKDTLLYINMLNNIKLDTYDYVKYLRNILKTQISTDNSNNSAKDLGDLFKSEYKRRVQTYDKINKIIDEIRALSEFEKMSDLDNVTPLSESKINQIELSFYNYMKTDSTIYNNFVLKLNEIVNQDRTGSISEKEKKESIIEFNKIVYNIDWLRFHDKILDFFSDAIDFFDISKRHYKDVKPLNEINKIIEMAKETIPGIIDEDNSSESN